MRGVRKAEFWPAGKTGLLAYILGRIPSCVWGWYQHTQGGEGGRRAFDPILASRAADRDRLEGEAADTAAAAQDSPLGLYCYLDLEPRPRRLLCGRPELNLPA